MLRVCSSRIPRCTFGVGSWRGYSTRGENDLPLKGKVALVTGSSSGLGKGIAVCLAQAGCRVTVNGFLDAGEVDALQEEVGGASPFGKDACVYHSADLSKPEEIESLVSCTTGHFGSLDILVNNAGIQHVDSVESFPLEKWDNVIAVNLSAVFHTSRLALPIMKEKGWGRIINISSVHGLVGSANKSAYVAAKHGVVGLTKVTALENARTGVTCNAICPGWVLTPLVQAQVDMKAKEEAISTEDASAKLLAEKQPAQKFVEIDDVAHLVKFLSSQHANLISGATYTIDGAWTAQ